MIFNEIILNFFIFNLLSLYRVFLPVTIVLKVFCVWFFDGIFNFIRLFLRFILSLRHLLLGFRLCLFRLLLLRLWNIFFNLYWGVLALYVRLLFLLFTVTRHLLRFDCEFLAILIIMEVILLLLPLILFLCELHLLLLGFISNITLYLSFSLCS